MSFQNLVSISGAPLCGKSTLIYQLQATLSNKISFLPDLPRQALELLDKPRYGGRNFFDIDPVGFQNYIGYAQLVAEDQPFLGLRILDKSLIDALAYWNVFIEQDMPFWGYEIYPKRYSVAIICELIDDFPAPTGVQDLHLKERKALQEQIKKIARTATEQVFTISGNKKERFQETIQILSDLHLLS